MAIIIAFSKESSCLLDSKSRLVIEYSFNHALPPYSKLITLALLMFHSLNDISEAIFSISVFFFVNLLGHKAYK